MYCAINSWGRMAQINIKHVTGIWQIPCYCVTSAVVGRCGTAGVEPRPLSPVYRSPRRGLQLLMRPRRRGPPQTRQGASALPSLPGPCRTQLRAAPLTSDRRLSASRSRLCYPALRSDVMLTFRSPRLGRSRAAELVFGVHLNGLMRPCV